MILNIRGTSGSGKSTVVKKLMQELDESNELTKFPIYRLGRKKPVAYHYRIAETRKPFVAIIGHYEGTCGGCDSINTYDECFGRIQKYSDLGYHVIYEGLRQSGDVKQISNISPKENTRILYLNTDIETCINSVIDRRKRKGNEKPFNEKPTIDKYHVMFKSIKRLTENGIICEEVNRENCLDKIKELLCMN